MKIFRNRWFIVAVLMLSAVSGHSWQVECFVAGTQILMADGSSKNIEDIQPGLGPKLQYRHQAIREPCGHHRDDGTAQRYRR